jgi:UDP-N-acetylglucosamine 2-epimerase (non-hydrolysing)
MITHIIGARPNYMKMAPVWKALDGKVKQSWIDIGQHYDPELSEIFRQQLHIPHPDRFVLRGIASYVQRMADWMLATEYHLLSLAPDLVIVYGDVDATFAGAYVARQLGIPIAHIEAGLRSYDREMPEEINRMYVDSVSKYLFTTCSEAAEELTYSIPTKNIFEVGNTMVDTYYEMYDTICKYSLKQEYDIVFTFHRPENVDNFLALSKIVNIVQLAEARGFSYIWPCHPRTKAKLIEYGYSDIKTVLPMGYIEFMAHMEASKCVITDSGGIQEETTIMNKPCITVRKNTERQVTVYSGTNVLCNDIEKFPALLTELESTGIWKTTKIIPMWDGFAGERIASHLLEGDELGNPKHDR